ncbi:MAG: SDR family oxidoreductase [Anaerolineales bacterium]|nr:SDR family oxidoreductase [Anaerolineales bacterium]
MSKLGDKNVLITGAASGIGRLMAHKISAHGAHIIAWDINAAGLEALRSELEAKDRKISTYVCNIAERETIYATAQQVLDSHQVVDVLINNAGIVQGKSILEASDEAIIRTFDVNTLSLFWMTRAFMPAMITKGSGHIVTVASAGGIVGTAKLTDYCASKFGAVGFDESLRLEMQRQKLNIKTTVVCPFYIDTGMFAGVKSRFGWFLPILKPENVADKVVKAIQRNDQRAILPWTVKLIYPLRLLPVGLADGIMGIIGINRTMDDFTGRQGNH